MRAYKLSDFPIYAFHAFLDFRHDRESFLSVDQCKIGFCRIQYFVSDYINLSKSGYREIKVTTVMNGY